MTRDDEAKKEWCDSIATLIVDELICCELVNGENLEKAVKVVAEEIFTRLIVYDYPPPYNPKLLAKNS